MTSLSSLKIHQSSSHQSPIRRKSPRLHHRKLQENLPSLSSLKIGQSSSRQSPIRRKSPRLHRRKLQENLPSDLIISTTSTAPKSVQSSTLPRSLPIRRKSPRLARRKLQENQYPKYQHQENQDPNMKTYTALSSQKNKESKRDIFEVESILEHKGIFNYDAQYHVHWKDYGTDHDTWEDEKDLVNCQKMLMVYQKKNCPKYKCCKNVYMKGDKYIQCTACKCEYHLKCVKVKSYELSYIDKYICPTCTTDIMKTIYLEDYKDYDKFGGAIVVDKRELFDLNRGIEYRVRRKDCDSEHDFWVLKDDIPSYFERKVLCYEDYLWTEKRQLAIAAMKEYLIQVKDRENGENKTDEVETEIGEGLAKLSVKDEKENSNIFSLKG